jgi:hypothetical protein
MGMTLTYIAAAISVVCWIIVLIRMFKHSVLHGILGLICSLYAFIWGWMNASAGLKNVMLLWTIAIVIGIIGGAIGGFSAIPRL